MKYDKILIDVSNAYHRAYYVGSNLTNVMEDGKEMVTGGISVFFSMVKRMERDFLNTKGEIYFIFDNTHSGENRRKSIDPDYKSNREKKDEPFYKAMDYLNLILMSYKDNYKVVKRPGSEADDLVSPLVRNMPESTILLVSNDMDWFRSISEKVHVAKYEKNDYVIYTPELFEEKYGFPATVKNICLYKAFRGDGSDNIPKGVSGIRENLLIPLIMKYSSIRDIIINLESENISDIWKNKIKESQARLELNMKLVSFEEVPIEELKEYIFACQFSPKILKSLYKSLNFNISKFDPRVTQFFPEKVKSDSFFQFIPLPRV